MFSRPFSRAVDSKQKGSVCESVVQGEMFFFFIYTSGVYDAYYNVNQVFVKFKRSVAQNRNV